jgi:hypothetical protein
MTLRSPATSYPFGLLVFRSILFSNTLSLFS